LSQTRKIFLAAAVLLLLAGAVARWLRSPTTGAELPFSTFIHKIEQSPEEFRSQALQISMGSGDRAEVRGKFGAAGASFVTTGYVSERFFERLSQANIPFEVVAPAQAGSWRQLLGTAALALLILGLLFLVFVRGITRVGGNLMRFRDSKAKLLTERERRVTFSDVAGIEEAQGELEEIVAYLADRTRFARLGGRIPRGVLMMGPPGTGKTLLARAIAGEAGVPFFSISGSDFVEMFVGIGASRVRALFEQGKKSAPCIIFIDEIDAVGRRRGAGLGGGHDEREQTLNQLLVEMDGFESNDGVILVAATNRPDVLDPALLRPGRFDRRITVPQPDVRGRLGILQVHTRKTPLAPNVDLTVIARGTPGFVGADLANLVNEAALLAARGDKDALDMRDFELARDRVLMGRERRSLVVSPKDRLASAYHEAGHTVVGKLMQGSDPIHKVTIIPRGRALGLTQRLPTEDRLSLSRESAEDQIAFAMGGRVAEEIIFGHVTTGAADDLETATALARNMVSAWGMSDRLGLVALAPAERAVFLGGEMGGARSHSEQTFAAIDDEVRRILFANHDRARRIVLEHLDELKRVAEALLELETIDGAEVDLLFAGRRIERPALPPPVGRPLPGAAATEGEHRILVPLPTQ
jgi:cell division protease FtsH